MLRTKNYAFECDYCISGNAAGKSQLHIRIKAERKMDAIQAFDNPAELAALSYNDKPVLGFSKLAYFRNEGELVFFALEG